MSKYTDFFPLAGGSGGGIGGSGTDTQMAIFDSTSTITSTQAVAVNSSSEIIMDVLRSSTSYADDNAALAGGVPYGGLYRTGSTVKINLLGSSPSDPSADVCGVEFTTVNTSTTAVTSGPTIVIATDASDWALKINQGIAAAAYYNYDIANANRGLYYNTYAFAVIQPQTGFRKPNLSDITTLINSPCSDTSLNPANRNSLATPAGTGNWDSSTFTNTTDRGNSGLNIAAYGFISENPNLVGTFVKNELQGGFWYDSSGNNYASVHGDINSSVAYITSAGFQSTSTAGFNVRFCKDIP